ncbi:MAG: glycosyltransferase [Desulfomonilaceae bacterium]|nr:glycosyltransferase [Desulfomonilaceae bacterium]
MKVDLHVHSKYSKRPSEWILQKLDCPESFTEPLNLYGIAKERGMSLVTLTDHNTIDGCLEIAHFPDVFISEEVTTYFPEDGCKLHVLTYNINRAEHEEIQSIRKNVYELVPYLRSRQIVHALAHPLYSVNRKLTVSHFEKCLLLFKNFEINGARSDDQNRCLQQVLSGLTRETVLSLAEKHRLEMKIPDPWIKTFTGGSDDHSSLTVGSKYTECTGLVGPEAFLKAVENRETTVSGPGGSPETLARNLYSVAYQFYDHKFHLRRLMAGDPVLTVFNRFLRSDETTERPFLTRLNILWANRRLRRKSGDTGSSILGVLQSHIHGAIERDPQLSQICGNGNGHSPDKKWFQFVNQVSNKVMLHFTEQLIESASGAHFFNVFHALGSAGALYCLLAPYFIAFSMFSEDRRFSRMVQRRFGSPERRNWWADERINVAHFTDTLFEINGVAETLKQQCGAARRLGKNYTVIACSDDDASFAGESGIHGFKPVGTYELPVYREQKIVYPPFLEMLAYCYERRFTHIHCATPGPVGLAGLGVARILNLPVVGTYHTALPQYAQYLTEDSSIADLMWKYIIWWYDQMHLIYVPSRATAEELAQRGLSRERILIFPRGVDTRRFHPSKRNGFLDRYCPNDAWPKLLYVGRLSKEKNLPLLAQVYRSLVEQGAMAYLVVVGDGPYREEMQSELASLPALFLGYRDGEVLPAIYASCDLFVFPSVTDTFGNVVLEAQASGLPVVVTDGGGPRENVQPGVTGVVVQGNSPESLLEAVRALIGDRDKLKAMGTAARRHVEHRGFDQAFERTWDLYHKADRRDEDEHADFDPVAVRSW